MKDIEYKHFRALSDVLLNSIKKKDYTIVETLSRFFYGAFKKFRDDSGGKAVVYPTAYYEVVYRIIEELASQPNVSNPLIEHRATGSVWLLGEGHEKEISEETYNWIWWNISIGVRYERDEFIINHWQTAHQYFIYSLKHVQPERDFTNGKFVTKNQEQIDGRGSSRRRFIEFHYVIGGLLLYKQRFKAIKRMFDYTTSIPPRYELLPGSMHEIFYAFNEMRDPFDRRYSFIEHKFPFPDLAGLNAGPVIKRWISSYFALLFLRQYTINPPMRPSDYPQTPKTQGEIKNWINSLPFFKTLVTQHLENKTLLEAVSVDFITKEWCEKHNCVYPLDFLDFLKAQLEQAYSRNAENLPISLEKEQRFLIATKEIIESTLNSYDAINNASNLDEHTDKWYVNGERMIQDKDAFSETPEADHFNFHSILGSITSEAISEGIAATFLFKTYKAFVLKPEDIFEAIDSLGIDNSHVIIGLGINIDHYVQELKVASLSENNYKGIKLVLLSGSRFTDTSVFIVKLLDLPSIRTLQLTDSTISTFSLIRISDTQNLYASVVDLSKATSELLKELQGETSEEELRKSALMTIGLALEISWRKEMRMIQLVEYSEYRQSGLPNTIGDIKQFVNTK